MKKNEKIRLNIETITGEGTGIGRVDGMAVFVPNTAVGDEVIAHIIKVKKSYAVGKVDQILSSSEDRIEVDCPAFKSCGGCAFRHISYEKELSTKMQGVRDAMQRIGGIDMLPKEIIPSPRVEGYRNKAQYPISGGKDGITYGFFARHSHRVIECDDCKLQPKVFNEIMEVIKNWADKNYISAYSEETGEGLLRHVLIRRGEATNELMVVPVINGEDLPFKEELVLALKNKFGKENISLCYNINKEDTNVVLGDKIVTVCGKDTITDVLCGVELEMSPLSFYQVNKKAAELLYKKGAEYIEDTDKVILDLYCGIGSIGLSFLNLCGKDSRKLIGVEIVPSAIENAKNNARRNGFENAEFFCGDATDAAEKLKEHGIMPDSVILDPPRKGCETELLNIVAESFCPKKIIYISCDPSTLARDVKYLSAVGYELIEYTPVDLFPRTGHIETVALLVHTASAI